MIDGGTDSVPFLHVVTDGVRWPAAPGPLARKVSDGGADRIHVRLPGATAREVHRVAREIVRATPAASTVVVHDRADVAVALWEEGEKVAVHLPESSFDPADLGAVLPRAMQWGASRHDPQGVRLARVSAEASGRPLDWILVGHVYATHSHPGAVPLGERGLSAAIAMSAGVPIVAIGGVGAAEVQRLRERGAAGVAILGAVFGPRGVEDEVRRVRDALDRWPAPGRLKTMNVTLNGRSIEIREGHTVGQLLGERAIEVETVVVELNREILPRSEVEDRRLASDDVLEVVRFVGGG